MKKQVAVIATIIASCLLVQYHTVGDLSYANVGDAGTIPLADELERLCKCDRQFGPPAPVLDPTLPIDVSLKNNQTCPEGGCQPCFDCFGWQLFLTLNWPVK